MTRAGAALAIWVGALSVLGCGAFDREADPVGVATDCPTVSSQLSGLTTLVDAGQLDGLQTALSDDLGSDTKTRLVGLIFQILDLYEPGTFTRLWPAVQQGTLARLVELLRGPLSTVVASEGWSATAALGQLLHDCTGRPLLVTLRKLLEDPAVRADVETLLGGDLDLLGALDQLGLDPTTLEGRVGFQALLRALVTGIGQPDFQLDSLTGPDGILRLLAPEGDPTLDALIRIVEALMAPGDALQSVQLVTNCLLETDAEDRLFGLVFDLITAPSEPAPLPERGLLTIYPGGTLELLDRLLLPLLSLLIDDQSARRSAVIVFADLLRAEVAARFLPDVITLIDSGVAQSVLELLVQFARGGGC